MDGYEVFRYVWDAREDTGAPHVWSHGGFGQDQDHWTGEEGPAFEDLGQRFMLAQERRMVENGLRALEGNGQGGRFGRERFCLTSKHLRSFAKRMATYSVASKCSQALFNDLRCVYDGAVVPLLAVSTGLLWTEHSERATMRTWAEAAGVPEEVRKQMGRWIPTADQAYERTGRSNVLRAQAGVAEFIKSHPRRGDPFDEGLIFSALTGKMADWGFPEGAIDLQMEKLMEFNVEPGTKRARLKGLGKLDERIDSDEEWSVVQMVRPTVFNAMPTLEDEEQPEEDDVPLGPGGGGAEKVPHGTYVLSVTGRGGRKTLSSGWRMPPGARCTLWEV